MTQQEFDVLCDDIANDRMILFAHQCRACGMSLGMCWFVAFTNEHGCFSGFDECAYCGAGTRLPRRNQGVDYQPLRMHRNMFVGVVIARGPTP